jgi:hypothetical protein
VQLCSTCSHQTHPLLRDTASGHLRRAGDRLDAVVHIVDLVISVIRDAPLSAGALHNRLIVVEPLMIRLETVKAKMA